MINHQNHAYSAGIPLSAGDRYYAQDLGRDFYSMRDTIGSGLLGGFGVALGTASLLRGGAVTVDGVAPNTTLDIPAGGAVLPYTVTLPDSYSATPPTTTTASVNMPISWGAFTIDVSTLGCTGVQTYKLYASYSEVVSKTRQRVKASGTYGYEVLPTLSLGATTGSIPAGSVLLCTFTYNSGASPISAVSQASTILSVQNKKDAKEIHYAVGTFHHEADYAAPSVWDPTNPEAYRPAIDLSAITDSITIDSTGSSSIGSLMPYTKVVSSKAVTFLRAIKATVRRGRSTEKSAFTLSTFAVTGGTTCTLVFATDTDLVAALACWIEDATVAGAADDLLTYTPDYDKSWVLNIPSNLTSGGTTVPAGDYAATSVTSSTKTVVITIPSTSNISATSTSVQCTLHPFRVPGAHTDQARIFASQGRVLQGANDSLIQHITCGRTRGMIHDHYHGTSAYNYGGSSNPSNGALGSGLTYPGNVGLLTVLSPVATGSAGPIKLGPETDVRATTAHIVFGLGELVA